MVNLLIHNDAIQVCVKADNVETNDFSYNITFKKDNTQGSLLVHKLVGTAFTMLNHINGSLIISLPLEGWNCMEISDEDYISNILDVQEHVVESLHKLFKDESSVFTRYLMVSYVTPQQQPKKNIVVKICCSCISKIGVNITIAEDNIDYNVNQGVKVEKIFRVFDNQENLIDGVLLLLKNRERALIINSIIELHPNFCEF